jgi:hypothetical protein
MMPSGAWIDFFGPVWNGRSILYRSATRVLKPQQVRQLSGIGFVAAVLETVVLPDGASIGQLHDKPRLLQTIHQPVPVVGGLDDHPRQFLTPWFKKSDNLRQIVRQTLLSDYPISVVRHRHHAVVRMQVNSAIFHLRPP